MKNIILLISTTLFAAAAIATAMYYESKMSHTRLTVSDGKHYYHINVVTNESVQKLFKKPLVIVQAKEVNP